MSSKSVAAAVALILVAIAQGGCGGGADASSQVNRVACIDATESTEPIRESYLPDLKEVAQDAIEDRAWLAVAACGANATGTVRWPLREELTPKGTYSGTLAERFTKKQVKRLTPRLERILATTSRQKGTPLGQMLAVTARQCDAMSGRCYAYIFTDGEWADDLLRMHDGVTEAEMRRYLQTYAPQLQGLAGATVYFAGVGYGTHLGEKRLHEAQQVAVALVEDAGGHVASWNVRLPSGDS